MSRKRKHEEEVGRRVRPKLAPTPEPYDDKDGHYIITPGKDITPRYKIMRVMGEGTFARVVEAWDRKHRGYVAIKIIRAIPKYRDAAEQELEILQHLRQRDPNGETGIIHLDKCFDFRNHVCMVFVRYGLSLYDFLRKNHFRPFQYHHVVDFAKSILTSVEYLHSLKLIHTDLKPENILLASSDYEEPDLAVPMPYQKQRPYRAPKDSAIKVIDLGSATYDDSYHASIVSTRHYRAPEIILGLGWSYPCDLWSVGCIIIELYHGDAVFQTHDNVEHLAMMEKLLGPLPSSLVGAVKKKEPLGFFTAPPRQRLRYPELTPSTSSVRHVNRVKTVESMFKAEHSAMGDLVKQLLNYSASRRITAAQALQHDVFH